MYGSHKLARIIHTDHLIQRVNVMMLRTMTQIIACMLNFFETFQSTGKTLRTVKTLLGLSLTPTWGTCAPTIAVISSPKLRSATPNIAVTVLLPAIAKGAVFQMKK